MQCFRTELSVYSWNVLVQRWNALRLMSGKLMIVWDQLTNFKNDCRKLFELSLISLTIVFFITSHSLDEKTKTTKFKKSLVRLWSNTGKVQNAWHYFLIIGLKPRKASVFRGKFWSFFSYHVTTRTSFSQNLKIYFLNIKCWTWYKTSSLDFSNTLLYYKRSILIFLKSTHQVKQWLSFILIFFHKTYETPNWLFSVHDGSLVIVNISLIDEMEWWTI